MPHCRIRIAENYNCRRISTGERKMMKKTLLVILLTSSLFLLAGWQAEFEEPGMASRLITIPDIPLAPSPVPEPDKNTKDYDVVVVGGEPEGVAAAIAAARNGANTLLIEKRDGLGGLMTYGMLNFIDIARDPKGKILNSGIFAEWHKLVGNDDVFDVVEGKNAFLKLVQAEPNLTLALSSTVEKVITENHQVTEIIVKDPSGQHSYTAKRWIDSTQDADLAALAGVPYFIGGEDLGIKDQKMAVTLMIHLKNVDWPGIKAAITTKKFGYGKMTATAAWGFGKLHQLYQPIDPTTHLRGLNIAKEKDGTVYINALQIFGADELKETTRQDAILRGKAETKFILAYLRKEFPGFENAAIADYPPELYVRETRHIQAEYQLPISDVWENRDQWDSIGFGGYPVDVQATSPNNYGFVIAKPKQYAIPFRSLIPLKVDNLLVASRASGFSSLAAGSARIVPTGMTVGQAAGTGAALSIQHEIDFRNMSKDRMLIAQLQQTLRKQGTLLYPFKSSYPYEGQPYYPAIRKLLTYGLISGGYDNNLQVNEPITEASFVNLLWNGVFRIDKLRYDEIKTVPIYPSTVGLTRDRAASIILSLLGKNTTASNPWNEVLAEGWISPKSSAALKKNKTLTRSEGFELAATILQAIEDSKTSR